MHQLEFPPWQSQLTHVYSIAYCYQEGTILEEDMQHLYITTTSHQPVSQFKETVFSRTINAQLDCPDLMFAHL